MRELNSRGFHGREFNAVNIGKIMKQNEFESKIIKGTRKYLVVMVDYDLHVRENKADASHFVPDVF